MRKNDFFDIENQIRSAVDSAFNCIDYVNQTAKSAINEVRNSMQDTSQYYKEKVNRNKRRDDYYTKDKRYTTEVNISPKYYVEKLPERAASIAYIIVGIFGSLVFGGAIIGFAIFQSFILSIIGINASIVFAILAVLLGTSILFAEKGKKIIRRNKRFKTYIKYLNGKNYCEIKQLGSAVNKKKKFVIKDLNKMIDLNMFYEPYFDEEKTYFMLGKEVYDAYLKSQESKKMREESEKMKDSEPSDNELNEVVKMGEDYINQIREANKAIEGRVISAKLDKLECVVRAIFDFIEKNSKKIPEVKKFINHYLPITLKLVNSYKELDSQMIQGENIKKAKAEIERSIDLVNSAFEKMLDNLFEEVAMDVSSDISVLETLFTQEGLTESDFKREK